MTTNSLTKILDPSNPRAICNLPIIGPLVKPLAQWLHRHGYKASTIEQNLRYLRQLVRWLQGRRCRRLKELDVGKLRMAHDYFCRNKAHIAGSVRALALFLEESKMIPKGRRSPVEMELEEYIAYLSEVCGSSLSTIHCRQRRLRLFLCFLRLDHQPDVLQNLRLDQLETYLRKAARTNGRASLHTLVCSLRSYLRFKYAAGKLRQPLHAQLAAPCVWRHS